MTGAGVRRGGRAALPTGELVVWSIADGRRGRRWREVTSLSGTVVRSVLLETDPAGLLTRLEIATAAGLLTLHPDSGETVLHGNVVTPAGIRHLAFDRTAVLVGGSPASAAVLVGGLAGVVRVGATAAVELVFVDDRLEPRAVSWTVSRVEPGAWRLIEQRRVGGGGGVGPVDGERRDRGAPGPGASASGEEQIARFDADGLPILAGDAWPLEI